MIYEVEGDILLTRAQLIAHGVAVNDTMTRGLARKLQEKFPTMREEFHAWCEEQNPEPGECWHWGDFDKQQVANLIIMEGADPAINHPGRATRVATHRALRNLCSLALEKRFTSIAMPVLGDEHSGLDWPTVSDMLHSQLKELLIPIFVYTKEKEGQLASEPGM